MVAGISTSPGVDRLYHIWGGDCSPTTESGAGGPAHHWQEAPSHPGDPPATVSAGGPQPLSTHALLVTILQALKEHG